MLRAVGRWGRRCNGGIHYYCVSIIPVPCECWRKGSGPLALIRPILPWNVSGSTSPRPSPQRQCFRFFSLIFSIPLLYFLLDLFSLSPPPTWLVFMVSLSPAADCCTSNLCSRLGMFFTLFNSLPVSAPPVSPLVH